MSDRWHLHWIFCSCHYWRKSLCKHYRHTTSTKAHPQISWRPSCNIWTNNSLANGMAVAAHWTGHCGHQISVHKLSMCGVYMKYMVY